MSDCWSGTSRRETRQPGIPGLEESEAETERGQSDFRMEKTDLH